MEYRAINKKVIALLTQLSDNQQLDIQQNKHIKLSGIFNGERRVLALSVSPRHHAYAGKIRSRVRRFIASLNIIKTLIYSPLETQN